MRHQVGLNPAHCSLKTHARLPDRPLYFTRLALAVQQARNQTSLMPRMSRGLALWARFPCWLHWVTPAGAWRAVKAVGSDIDLRSGESRDLFPVNLLIVEGDLNPDPSVISSKTNCVEVEGTNSSFAELSGAAVSLRRNQYRDLG